MELSVQDITSVDKEITIKADRSDLEPKFNKAYKKYKKEIQMPGFRPGNVPVGLIKKRFGKEIEMEEINTYVQEVYENDIVPEYQPVGETQMKDLSWEDDKLEVTFKVGAKPDFELAEIESITVDKMVHDVTDEEVEEELERTLEREGNWVEVEEGEITEEYRVTVDAVTLDDDGNPVEGEKDEDQKLDLRDDSTADFRENLVGKKKGDVVDVSFGDEDKTDKFQLHVKKVEKMEKATLTDELAKEQSNGEAKNVDEFKSFLKSRMQQYYDQSADDMFRQDAMEALTKAHDFEVPEVMVNQIQNSYVEYAKQQTGGQLPPNFNEEEYKENLKDQAAREGKWVFISEKLQEKFDDIEIGPEDIEEFIGMESARHGVPVDQMKGYYAQNPGQLENLRNSIRENKVFDKLNDAVTINELSKDEFRKKREEESEEKES
ncbi:trigger factor [Rhodohalobacter sp. SW132]|uniref:trigger factor n=1 Tax=Rhodohalobacter sp. SW132 TaxID=2293433 RepID=UPI000E26F663|nr:trigger factor [Rhodohalobacter sp. SW132]REL39247.1 trigger factor [Rhodohalobacter sp. SW132]